MKTHKKYYSYKKASRVQRRQLLRHVATVTAAVVFVLSLMGFSNLFVPQAYAASFTVTKTADTLDGTCDADCSLREAVAAANASAGADVINFSIPTSDGGYTAPSGGTQGYFTITLASTAINLTDDSGVFINGYSQSGSSRNTAAFGQTINTVLNIELNSTIVSDHAMNITGDNNHLAGLSMRSGTASKWTIDINTSSNNWIEGNFFGSNITGATTNGFSSITMENSSNTNILGTNGDGSGDIGERNLFLGNSSSLTNHGIIQTLSTSHGQIIAGNYIGVDRTSRTCGTGTMRRQQIILGSTTNNQRVGTNYDGISDTEEANILACVNTDTRTLLRLSGNTGSVVQGNYIGTNTFLDNLSSTSIPGIDLRDATSTGYIIKGNTIAFNAGSVGIRNTLSTNINNTFSQNTIFSNGGIGIDLAVNGVTVNDAGDVDTGANNLMNYPVITKVQKQGTNLIVTANLDFNASEGPFVIELFDNDSLDGTGYGEGQYFIGSASVSTLGNSVTFTVPITSHTPTTAANITATATNATGSTSEFSAAPTDPVLYVIAVPVSDPATDSTSQQGNVPFSGK